MGKHEGGWLKTFKDMQNLIKDFKAPKDRLARLSQIIQTRNMVVFSCNNWMYWLNNPVLLDTLTDEQINRVHCFWLDIAKRMMGFDYAITNEVESMYHVAHGNRDGRMIGIEPQ